MREIHIDLSSDYYLQQPKVFGGYVGEHNESKLVVKLPDRMIRDDISYYYFEFQTVLGEHITSPNIYKNTLSSDNEISIVLWEQLLPSAGNLKFCVNAIELGENDTVTIKGKTSVFTLHILESPTGEDVLIDSKSSKEELQKSIDSALKEAKDSGEFKGTDGYTPQKGIDYFTDEDIASLNIPSVDQTFNPESENAQSGKAVAEALSGYVVAEVGKGLSSNDFTNEDKEKLYSALQNENVDQTYIPNSENPQSGKAVAEAVSDKQDSLVSGTNIKTINNQSILGSGNITIEGATGEKSDIPAYWTQELEEKADEIQQAMETAGRNKSAFLWYTDAHWPNNSKMSPSLLKYLCKNTPINKVNFGGDIIGDTLLATREEMKYLYEWRKAIKDLPNHHSVFGNHDMFDLDTVGYEDDNYRYAFLLAPEESYDMVMGDGNYYYIDNPCEKTRYLYIAFMTSDHAARKAQGQFIVDAIKSVAEGWHIVAIAHRWWQYSSSSTPTTGAVSAYDAEILSVFDAYNARGTRSGSNYFYAQDFTEAKGKVEFCIGGHIHVDYDFESEGGIPVIITTADTNQNRVPDSTVDSGTVGTTTEAAVFGIVADYNEETTKITVVGVGRGTSRVVRNSSVKVSSISDITYLGDTTVGATIDKSKFTFTVNYSNGTTDTITGATSVSPATIGVVGNNTVTISYTEGTTTVSGTTTIVGTPVPVANLLNLDRTYVSGAEGENIGAHFDTSKAYLNVIYGNGVFDAKSCTVSDITENGVTVKESGRGGVYVGYPIDASGLNTNNIRVTFDYSGTGKCRTNWTYISPNSGVAAGAKPIFMNDSAGASGSVDVTIDRQGVDQIIIYFGSNTSGTKTYSNISVTAAD